MKEHPILFSGEMVRAILEGRKTQTRRVIKNQPYDWAREFEVAPDGRWTFGNEGMYSTRNLGYCPYGQPGDRLWARESFSTHVRITDPQYLPPDYPDEAMGCHYWADGDPEWGDWSKPKPSIFMPRWASRITLEVTGVCVERVQEISEADAIAEGVAKNWLGPDKCPPEYENEYERYGANLEDFPCWSAKESYQTLWDSINSKRGYSWDSNPYVWVIEFKRVDGGVK